MGIFSSMEQTWLTVKDVTDEQLGEWLGTIDPQLAAEAAQLPYRLPGPELERRLAAHAKWHAVVQDELRAARLLLLTPHLFIVADADGCALSLVGQECVMRVLAQSNIAPGTSFAKEHAGINAVSLAVETGQLAAVCGEEHTLLMFHDWISVCFPVRVGGEPAGYVGLCADEQESLERFVAFMESLSANVQYKLKKDEHAKRVERHSFDQFHLTEREKQIAGFWLQNWSTMRIAHHLGISEGTVRTMLKKIYAKLKVNDKGQFMRKFLLRVEGQ